MLYHLHELQKDAMKPLTAWAQVMAESFNHPLAQVGENPFFRRFAAGYDLLHRLGKDYEKPSWQIDETTVDGQPCGVFINTVKAKPFCRLLHFQRDLPSPVAQPKVLVVAPLSGHHATLLRDTVRALIADHDVYITDWLDARTVPLAKGEFHLDDYIAYVIEFIQLLGPDVHLISVCQPTVPVLAAVSLMASQKDPKSPRTMTMMGGPIDPRKNPTTVNNLATTKPFEWFVDNVIWTVPERYAGAGRKVYPGFLQHTGFVAMNPDRHLKSHWDYYTDLLKGDQQDAESHRKFYDEYNAVLDLDAAYYLETIKTVFQEHRLPLGTWDVNLNGKALRVDPSAIKKTALLTIEGELDDISGSGQTKAALDLCSGISAKNKAHFTAEQCGHYGIFSGRRWREAIYPKIKTFIAANN